MKQWDGWYHACQNIFSGKNKSGRAYKRYVCTTRLNAASSYLVELFMLWSWSLGPIFGWCGRHLPMPTSYASWGSNSRSLRSSCGQETPRLVAYFADSICRPATVIKWKVLSVLPDRGWVMFLKKTFSYSEDPSMHRLQKSSHPRPTVWKSYQKRLWVIVSNLSSNFYPHLSSHKFCRGPARMHNKGETTKYHPVVQYCKILCHT